MLVDSPDTRNAGSPAVPESPGRVLVMSSVNDDLVVRVARSPGAGETVLAREASHHPGGKGGNQAVAAARVGATVHFLGAVGDDEQGRHALGALDAEGVDVTHASVVVGASTGQALVLVGDDGENRIVVVPGANAELSADRVTAGLLRLDVGARDVCLLGFEVPVPVVAALAVHCLGRGATVLVNPSPVAALPDELAGSGVVLVVNANEARQLAGHDDLETATRALCEWSGGTVIATAGSDDTLVARVGGARCDRFPVTPVVAVDTTGAGDTFTGVLAAWLSAGRSLDASVATAIRAAGLAVQGVGARGAMPTAADLSRPSPPTSTSSAARVAEPGSGV